ncbi:FAD-dependent oxidoreductase [Halorussus halophilus]|uniref:FAD-dependent oxidoreductase n=1 Tax=Halorussus halophilus TaxID=2650975 RepID=UPI001300D34B|nr:FAD-dependent oxidoreductase [Halorussus halophilus]
MDGTAVEVRAVESVGTDTVALTLETPPEFDAEPGQFVQLGATVEGEEVARYYTLSSPDMADTFETTVEVDPDGSLTPYLANLEAGDTVEVAGPFGESYYEGEQSVVVLAGGPGVGPAVGIGERALAEGADVTIVYEDADPAHETRLATLASEGATVVITDDVSSDDVVTLLADSLGQTFVYGFANFVDEATAALDAAGLDTADAKVESFGPAPE